MWISCQNIIRLLTKEKNTTTGNTNKLVSRIELKISLFSQTRDYTVGWAFIAYYSFASVIWVYLKIVNALLSLNKPGSLKQQSNMRLTLTRQYNHVFVKTRKFLTQSGNDEDVTGLNASTTAQTAGINVAKRYIVWLQNITYFSSPYDHSFLLMNTSI